MSQILSETGKLSASGRFRRAGRTVYDQIDDQVVHGKSPKLPLQLIDKVHVRPLFFHHYAKNYILL